MTGQVSKADAAVPVNRRQQRDSYLKALAATLTVEVPDSLAFSELRNRAQAILKEHTFPHTQQEDWRFTDLAPMLPTTFTVQPAPEAIDADVMSPLTVPEAAVRVVMVNGQFQPALSSLEALPVNVRAGSLASLIAVGQGEPLQIRLGQSAGSHEVFTALNTVGFQDASVVWVPRDTALTTPVHIIHLSVAGDAPLVASPRCIVIAETGSALTLVETFCSGGNPEQFINGVTEVWVDPSAQVTHIRLQQEGAHTFHVGKTAVTQGQDSRYLSVAVGLGGRLARHNLEVYQTGPQTDTRLYGLTAIAANQLADTHSVVAFNHPHGTAEQLHKSIVAGQAHSVFNGKIWVPKEAQHTNASQLNRTLLLSDGARVDTKPELDIVADNVKCAHGATVSQLDAREMFYLQSRGISPDTAKHLLIDGFGLEIAEHIPIPSIKSALAQTLNQIAEPAG